MAENFLLITANEGYVRDYDAFSEESRVKDCALDPAAFEPDIQDDSLLGRLKVTTTMGDKNGDGLYESLYAYGARSFSIWKKTVSALKQVFDSGDQLEQITAAALPDEFNSDNSENGSFFTGCQ
ncbi:MAG: choice-of-anchor I domain-containing protein [bacterium]